MSTVKTKNVQIGADGTASNNFTIYQPSTPDGTSRWAVGVSGATTADVVTVNSSGNVGIGTTSPAGALDIRSGSDNPQLQIRKNSGGDSYARFNLYNTSTAYFQLAASPSTTDASSIMSIFTSGSGGNIMSFLGNGNVLVGTTSNFASGSVQGIAAQASGNASLALNRTTDTGAVARFYQAGTLVGRIDVTGSATSYVTSSDYRLKENIVPMIGALDKVAQLKPCTYTWKIDGSNGQGFIAHELQEVVPDCVTGEKDAVNEDGSINPQGIDTSKLVATLTAAIQELTKRVQELEAKVN